MELVSEKRDFDSSNDNKKLNSAQPLLDSSYQPSAADDTNAKEAEELSERVARDLKDGLHPLKVLSLSLSLSLLQTQIRAYSVSEF